MEYQDHKAAAVAFAELCARLGLSVGCAFVPFSQSRNAKEKSPSLNWRCAVTREGRPITGLEAVDYMQGSGHCPAAKLSVREAGGANSIGRARSIAKECETGKTDHPYAIMQSGKPIAAPTAADVISCLCRDSDVIDYARFEDWAGEFGYDPDSRSAEKTYRACLETALALRAAIGEAALSELREIANQL